MELKYFNFGLRRMTRVTLDRSRNAQILTKIRKKKTPRTWRIGESVRHIVREINIDNRF